MRAASEWALPGQNTTTRHSRGARASLKEKPASVNRRALIACDNQAARFPSACAIAALFPVTPPAACAACAGMPISVPLRSSGNPGVCPTAVAVNPPNTVLVVVNGPALYSDMNHGFPVVG